jgi:hypothetical protein
VALITPWVQCDCCEDYICSIHEGEHVADCACPVIDDWAGADLFPYEPNNVDEVNDFLSSQPG